MSLLIEQHSPAALGRRAPVWWQQPRVLLGFILLLAAVLRLARLGSESMWFDESLTVTTARLPLSKVLGSVEFYENMPPLYFYVINLWVKVAGSSDLAMRLPSALFGIAAVGAMYAFARRMGPPGRETSFGLIAALLLAISRYHIAYCQQARAYSLMVLLVLVSCWSFAALLRPEPQPTGRSQIRWQWIYLLSSSACLWTQPFSALSLVAQNLYLLLCWLAAVIRERRWVRSVGGLAVRRWLFLQALVAISFGPWVNRQLMAAQIGSPWMRMPTLAGTLLSYADGLPLLIAFGVLALLGLLSSARCAKSAYWLGFYLALVPVAVPIAASTAKHPLFVPRYGIAALVGIELLVASGVTVLPGRMRGLALLTVIGLSAPGLASDLSRGTTAEHRADVRAAAAWVDAHAARGAGYCVTDGLQSRVFEAYRRRDDLRACASAVGCQQWWLIFQPPRNGRLPAAPPGFLRVQVTCFAGVEVAEFQRERAGSG